MSTTRHYAVQLLSSCMLVLAVTSVCGKTGRKLCSTRSSDGPSVHLPPATPPPTPPPSPSRGGDIRAYVYDINQPSLPAPLYSVLVSVSVFMSLSTAFDSINFPDNSLFSYSVLPVFSLCLIGPINCMSL